jgi:hypothetical protein
MKEITRLGVSPSPEACGITVDDGGKSGLAGSLLGSAAGKRVT